MDGEQEAKLALIIREIVKQLLGEKDWVGSFHGNQNFLGEERVGAKEDAAKSA